VTGARARALAAGVGLAAAYVWVALATLHHSGRPALPVFDGFAPPPAYDWVKPPPGVAGDNRKPAEATKDILLVGSGSVAADASTSDGQAVITLEAGAVAAHFPDTAVRLNVTPIDPGTLGPLPTGMRAESNAYRVRVTYVPSGAPVESLDKPGTIALTAAGPASALLYSRDGTAWTETQARPFGDSHGLFSELSGPGYYVSVSRNAPRKAPRLSSSAKVILVIVLAVAASGAVVLATPIRRAWSRSRRRHR
jgi:hypothetical protein